MLIFEVITLKNEFLSVLKRKKTLVDLNTQFSNIELIKRAQEEAEVA